MSRHICSGTISLPPAPERCPRLCLLFAVEFEASSFRFRFLSRATRSIKLYTGRFGIRQRGRVRGRAPPLGGEGAEEPSRGTRPAVVRVVRAAAAVYDKVISSLNVVVAGSRGWFSLASFILRSLVFRHIAASGPGASASKI